VSFWHKLKEVLAERLKPLADIAFMNYVFVSFETIDVKKRFLRFL